VTLRMIRTLTVLAFAASAALPLAAAPQPGKISGVVVDPHGTPQMGATVFIISEQAADIAPMQLLTNDRGLFSTESLASGFYSIRATLAGFLPAVEQHVHVKDAQITNLHIELGSIFSSLDKFRRADGQNAPPDEWTWTLRTSAATRPILRWDDDDGEVTLAGQMPQMEIARQKQARSLFELTNGGMHPGSISNLSDAPATVFAYDENLGAQGHLVFAGQFGYESASATGGFVAEWLPSGNPHTGPVSTLVIHESELGPGSPAFRGTRLSHDNQFQLGDRFHIRYGAELLTAGFEGTTTSVRPRAEIAYQFAPNWTASATIANHPWQDSDSSTGALESALENLDAFPTLLVRDNRSVLADDLHEELAIEHTLSPKSSLTAAVFHDHSDNTAVIGRGNETSSDFLQDFYSDAFAYDGGSSSSWGARLAYEQKITDLISAAVVYAWAGALVPSADENTSESLRDLLQTQYQASLAFRAIARMPRVGTQLTVSYKWIDGKVVSQQDAYGEAMYNVDPDLSLIIRQRLPKFVPGHATVLADFGNLLAQGYVPLRTADGSVVLVPSYRSFRGGVSFQF
jgi:Carboxypeptidase regulatory-like domain